MHVKVDKDLLRIYGSRLKEKKWLFADDDESPAKLKNMNDNHTSVHSFLFAAEAPLTSMSRSYTLFP